MPEREFLRNQPCGLEEDLHTEFKRVRAVGDVEHPVLEEYAVGFLNSDGGSIFWGIRDDGIIVGIPATRAGRDQFRILWANAIRGIEGDPPLKEFDISFHPVCDQHGQVISETYVVETSVPKGSAQTLYWTAGGVAYLRLDGVNQKLKGPQIEAEIERRRQVGEADGGAPFARPPAPEAEVREHCVRYCQYLLDNHEEWSSMSPHLYISPEVMDIAPARVVPYVTQADDSPDMLPDLKGQVEPWTVPEYLLPGPHGQPTHGEGVDLLDAADESDRSLVILGDPGMGKSVALERLALKYAARFLDTGQGYVPVIVRLRNYSSQKRDLQKLITVAMQAGDLRIEAQRAQEILDNEKLVILFDALDEALHDPDVIPDLETFVQQYPQHKMVISCRTKPYQASGDRLGGCDKLRIIQLHPVDAEKLWNSRLATIEYTALPTRLQDLLRTPLLLHLAPYATKKGRQQKIRTRSQLVDLVVTELYSTLRPSPDPAIERCLFRVALEMQGSQEYSFAAERVFVILSDDLASESFEYQQEIAAEVLEHPMLVTLGWNTFSFWHPVLQEYFAARGLQDAVLDQGDVELVLQFLGHARWIGVIVYLASLLDDATKLVEYILDFDRPELALVCLREARSYQDGTVEAVMGQVAQRITAICDAFQHVPVEITRMYFMALCSSNEFFHGEHPDRIHILSFLVADPGFQTYTEPYVLTALESQDEIRQMGGLYWLYRMAQHNTDFSDHLIDTVMRMYVGTMSSFRADASVMTPWTVTCLLVMRLLPLIANRHEDLALWEGVVDRAQADDSVVLVALVALSRTEGDEPLPIIRRALRHQLPQVRLAALWGVEVYRQKADLLGMVFDPNPVVAHNATFSLARGGHALGDDFDADPGLFKIIVENLIAPLAGRLPDTMFSEQFFDLHYYIGPLAELADPFDTQNTTHLAKLIHAIIEQGLNISRQDSAAAIVALIWGVAVADSSLTEVTFRSDLEDARKSLRQVKITAPGQLYVEGYPQGEVYASLVAEEGRLSSEPPGELLTEEHVAYIKSWTDHEPTRELAAAVLSGQYQMDP